MESRTYRQNDSVSRTFGVGATHPYEIFLVGDTNPWTYVDLILPDGGRVHATAFADANAVAFGVGGRAGTRNAPTTLNAMFNESLFWDGRARTLEEQIRHPLVNASEMGMADYGAVAARVAALPEYRGMFRRAFREGITIAAVM